MPKKPATPSPAPPPETSAALFPELGVAELPHVRSLGGRPIKFDAARKGILLTALRGGSTRTAACALADVSLDTLRDHALRDPEFLGQVVQAEEEAVTRYTSRIQKAAYESEVIETFDARTGAMLRRTTKYDWKAAAWWLEHHPTTRKIFGAAAEPPSQTLIVVNPNPPVAEDASGWNPDQAFAAQVVAILQRAGQLPEEVEPDDLAPVLIAPPQSVPAAPSRNRR